MLKILRSERIIHCAAGVLGCAAILAAGSVDLQRSNYKIHVTVDSRPFTTYYFDPAIAKPYLMPLRTASGIIVTRGFPVGDDVSAGNPKASAFEPHQRPLYFGHGDLDGLDFWQEQVFDKYYNDHGHQAYGRGQSLRHTRVYARSQKRRELDRSRRQVNCLLLPRADP